MNLHQKIRFGELKEAFGLFFELLKKQESPFYADLMLLSAQYHDLEKSQNEGVISHENAQLTKARLIKALLALLEKYEKEFGEIDKNDSQNFGFLPKNDKIVKNVKNKGNMSLQDFKNNLKDLLDKGKLSEIFE